jgi:hypothetical protein
MESPLPIVVQEFFLAGTCLPSSSLATDIRVHVIRTTLQQYYERA